MSVCPGRRRRGRHDGPRHRPDRRPRRLRDRPPRPPAGPWRARAPKRCGRPWRKAPRAGAGASEEAAAAASGCSRRGRSSDLAGCDLVIEAAPEQLELKREIFNRARRGSAGRRRCWRATPLRCACRNRRRASPQPERVVGMHFFNPPPLMKLVEIVAAERLLGAGAGERRPRSASGWAARRSAPRTPRLRRQPPRPPFSLESLRMLGDGLADAATIDRIVRLGGGFRMGPFELLDLIGLDVNLEIARSFFAQGGEVERWRPSPIQERLVAEGKFGRKSGHGYYDYDEDSKREPDPDLRSTRPRSTPSSWPRSTPPPRRSSPPRRPDRQRGRLRPRRGDRLPRGHGHGDEARLQLADGPGRVHRADRRPPRRRPARAACSARRARPTRRRRDCAARSGSGMNQRRGLRRGPPRPRSPRFDPPRVETADGRVVWELESYGFLEEDCPETVHPSLWRQASSTASPASSRWRRASTSCAASTSRTCTSSRASGGSSSSTR